MAENQSVLTACITVQQKRVLELEVQVFGDWLCQVLHAESVHNGETMSRRCQSEGREGKSYKKGLNKSLGNRKKAISRVSEAPFTWCTRRVHLQLLSSPKRTYK